MGRHAILIAVIGGLASPALAQTAPSNAVGTLVRQAQRWSEQGRPELAALSMERALAADPRNPEALAAAAQIEAARRDTLRGATLDRAAIEQARAFAHEGRTEDAVARYRATFGAAGPTPAYAVEYYQTLAGSAAGREEGANALARLAAQPGATDRVRLANAQTMTFQPATRTEGVRQLATLADRPELAEEARRAWRQALLFSGRDPAAAPMLKAYLDKHPDPDISRQLDAIDAVAAASPADSRRRQGAAERAQTRATDTNGATALSRDAVAQAPDDPWGRLDLARVLRRQGRADEGRALVEEVAARARTPDAYFAAALFAEEDGRPADTDTFLALVPPARRTADMGRLQARSRAAAEVARAAALLPNGGGEGRAQLITLAARPDPSGATAAAAIRALGQAGDAVGAGEAARVAQAANRAAGPAARIAIAGALLSAGLEPEAASLADQLEGGALAPEQRRDLASLRAGIAIRASDRLNEAGRQAEAFERLRPVVTRSPENADGQLALARLYQSGRKPDEALRIAEAVLARDPRNLDARRGAVDAALSLGDHRRAETLVADAERLTPNDSRVMLLRARVARGSGDEARARALLAQAAARRRAELGVSTASAGLSDLANPFGGANAPQVETMPRDATSRDIARESAAVWRETRPAAAAELGLRSRTGSGGLDKLNKYSATAEATITPPGINGRLTARLTAITIDEGKLVGNGAILGKFGGNAALGKAAVPAQTSAAGAAIGIAYNHNDTVKVEVGTTPIGFPKATLVGGVEVAPRLGDNLRLRLTAERRPVTDSLLSYAGTRDSVTGTRWGMVEHTGGHGQIEASLGAGNVYAGGGYQVFDGTHVVSNRRVDAGAGYSVPLFKQSDAELTSGIDLIYLGYSKAVEGFTIGQGGYFSPQYFFAANIPLDYRGRSGDFSYHLGAVAGYAKWKENASPLFPLDAILQAQADAAARANPLVPSRNQAQGRSGFTGGLRADGDFDITPTLRLSGGIAYDKAANWNETRVTVRLRDQF